MVSEFASSYILGVMMGDLHWACGVLLAISVGLFHLGQRVAEYCPRAGNVLATATSGLLVAFAATLHGKLVLAAILPLSNVVVLGNLLPPAASLLGGILFGNRGVPRWRRMIAVWFLLSGAWLSVYRDVASRPPQVSFRWYRDGTVIQTNSATCSPSAAATLLHLHGIEATEREMARLCLTRTGGTPRLGLYRGLKLKTRGTPWRVEVVRVGTDRLDLMDDRPVVLSVRLDEADRSAGGLSVGRDHCVVFLGLDADGNAHILDPTIGYTRWSAERLARVCREGLRLVPRNP